MAALSKSTEALIVMLNTLNKKLGKEFVIHSTKTNILFPDCSSVIAITNTIPSESLYINMITRYSRTAGNYVLSRFYIYSYDRYKPGTTDPLEIFVSQDYRSLIHEDTFLAEFTEDVDKAIDVIRKDLA